MWTGIVIAVGVFLYSNLQLIDADLSEAGYLLNGDLETGFMRINTDTGHFSLCLYQSGQTARCLQWRP